jgi:hypothetical protein
MLDKRAAAKASINLNEYSLEKGIYMKINYFNADHTHALVDLPTNLTIEELVKLLKGSSSHWINEQKLLKGRFAWAGVTAHFLYRTLIWIELPTISPARKSIIANDPFRRSLSCLCEGTGWNGEMRETGKDGSVWWPSA